MRCSAITEKQVGDGECVISRTSMPLLVRCSSKLSVVPGQKTPRKKVITVYNNRLYDKVIRAANVPACRQPPVLANACDAGRLAIVTRPVPRRLCFHSAGVRDARPPAATAAAAGVDDLCVSRGVRWSIFLRPPHAHSPLADSQSCGGWAVTGGGLARRAEYAEHTTVTDTPPAPALPSGLIHFWWRV